jgi:hypothetical protein
MSLGLPIAYLFALLFIHVPGAIAHMTGAWFLSDTEATRIGIQYTAIGAVCFVAGVWLAHRHAPPQQLSGRPRVLTPAALDRFTRFCLIAGLLVTYTLRLVVTIPSIGAIIEKSGGIWVLGALLGLQAAVLRSNFGEIAFWGLAMSVYPVLTLLLGGFLSFGSTPVFIILSALVISIRSNRRVAVAVPVVSYVFFIMFLSYFQNRDDIRGAVWGRADLSTRARESLKIVTGMELFDPGNPRHLDALDQRLNQNYFVGRAAQRLDTGEVGFLYGRSFWEGAMSLVPRIVWPSKPAYAGSPGIIREMTGFIVNDNTSYGVGNVMEFHINFGMPSLVLGFLVLGLVFGWLDLRAALELRQGDLGRSILFFMPAAAMIHPNGSIVEMTGGAAAAFFAALGWRWVWEQWSAQFEAEYTTRAQDGGRIGQAVRQQGSLAGSKERHNGR